MIGIDQLPLSEALAAEQACQRFEAACTAGERPRIEDHLRTLAEPVRGALLYELLQIEIEWRRRAGEAPTEAEYLARFPEVESAFLTNLLTDPTLSRPHGSATDDLLGRAPEATPAQIGRYRVERLLGEGGFGRVFLAHDDQLHRAVAVKVPHRRRLARPEDADAYLAEARVLAHLDHPNIVPVHDVGRTEEGLPFVVSKFIEGSDLARRLKTPRPSFATAAGLLATVAEALHHAHEQGLIHRDIKPGNILLDAADKPYLADFGLALRETDLGTGASFVGTPSYMSPEQARGEGHRVDGRSDIFSLGVVLYELLTGRRPFRAELPHELLDRIAQTEPTPPRQIDASVPRELERICLKALAKRAADRHATAQEFAEDLRQYVAAHAEAAWSPGTPKVVPKGLRAFDAGDADFFLDLLPGPRDRDAMPDSIRFWHDRIEETNAARTFSVGLLYGPSGCGKSSLVKAGLLPRLGEHVTALYIEGATEQTEYRLLRELRRRFPELAQAAGLVEALTALRREPLIPTGGKVLLVLDQFEQWLHARHGEENTDLVRALRQCDGGRVQCLVLVRDDFWMAATRFLRELEVPLLEGHNAAAVDLFPVRHAEAVLAAFGRAFGALPERGREDSQQQRFLRQAVAGLAQDDRVICVRLALFAEMMRARPWTPAALAEVGGAAGVGVTFLEEAFRAATAAPRHGRHLEAARAMLHALLPETGTEIKGHQRSRDELLAASGYGDRPADFAELLRLLDGDLRLITPTEGGDSVAPAQRYYQLTHDYLVPSLREWLTHKQKETPRGRAELRLAERTAAWQARPKKRQLPVWWEWLNIRWYTRPRRWTAAERELMRQADRYHVARLVLLGVGFLALGLGVAYFSDAAWTDRLLNASTTNVPALLAEPWWFRVWTEPLLRKGRAAAHAAGDARRELNASLALLPLDGRERNYLYRRLLDAEPQEVPVICAALAPHRQALVETLWAVAEHPEQGKESQRLRAACALALYDPGSDHWAGLAPALAADLVRVPSVHLVSWIESLRPVKARLLPPLASIFRDPARRETERSLATDVLADYVADEPALLADLLMDADEKQFAILFPRLRGHAEHGVGPLVAELDRAEQPGAEHDKERFAKRQANAAVALLRLGRDDKVWPLFQHRPDPRVRSYLIHLLYPLGTEPGLLVKRLEEEINLSARRALLLALGEFGDEALTARQRDALLPMLVTLYGTTPDAGLRGAAGWLLRRWNEGAQLKRLDRMLADGKLTSGRQWYVNRQGQSFTIVQGPVDFSMGSPPGEAGRVGDEARHRRHIGRSFAISTTAVTRDQFQQALPDFTHTQMWRCPEPDCPILGVTWYDAATYCNWLSAREGIPESEWCYLKTLEPAPGYLRRTGYRLPTEAEWEYACRAGAVTARYYGQSAELLGKYAWYLNNAGERSRPVGTLKPNDLGLFDMHGNVWTWTQDRYDAYPRPWLDWAVDDAEMAVPSNQATIRPLRGGSFTTLPGTVRAAYRSSSLPTNRNFSAFIGIRLARTLPAE